MINKKPYIEVNHDKKACWQGWKDIIEELNNKIQDIGKKKTVIVVECYHGTYENLILQALKEGISPTATCITNNLFKEEDQIRKMVQKYVLDGHLFGRYFNQDIEEFFDEAKLEGILNNIDFIDEGIILIFGIGASKIYEADILIYSDMSPWEIQQRLRRNDISNIGVSNATDTFLKKYRWAVYVDWKVCNRLKKKLIPKCDYFLESNNWAKPKLVNGELLRQALKQTVKQPFFQAPFFDPELWDTQLKNGSDNSPVDKEFFWYFNCMQDENNILLKFDDILFEIPVINLIYYQPKELMGKLVFKKFGSELPIYLDFVDTLESENMLFSVEPETDFIRDQFDVHYFPDKIYYFMHAKADAKIHLCWKKGLSVNQKNKFLTSIGKNHTNANKFLQEFKVKSHDFLAIPAGVIHGSGENAMVLRIGSAPDIYSVKLWDSNGEYYSFLSKEFHEELISFNGENIELSSPVFVLEEENKQKTEKLGSDLGAWLEVRRFTFESKVHYHTEGNIHVLNLVEGDEVIVSSPNDQFPPLIVHYAETFIMPACIGEYCITPSEKNKSKQCKILRLFIN